MFLFSTDIDGTIYDGPKSAKMFAEFWNSLGDCEEPPLLAYNTGRAVQDTRDLIDTTGLPAPNYIIGGVGTEIFDFSAQETLTEWRNELSNGWSYERVRETVQREAEGVEAQPDRCQNAFKCSWYWHDKCETDLNELYAALSDEGLEIQVVYSSSRDLDILPRNANKGNAVSWLAERLKLPRSHIRVAGDSGNDASMYLIDGVSGIVVANAEPSLVAAVSGADVFRSSLPCAAGVIEGIEAWLKELGRAPQKDRTLG